jgi:hypothetical protein
LKDKTMLNIVFTAFAAGLGYYLFEQNKKPSKGKASPEVPPILNELGQTRITPREGEVLMPVPKVIATTAGGNKIISITPINPDTGKSTVTNTLATVGKAIEEAHALYDFLKLYPPNTVNQTKELTEHVIAFQRAHNSDPNGNKVAGPLSPNGIYDTSTSSVLTVYTGSPVPPAEDMPLSLQVGANPNGLAAMTGSNLYAYLKTHKNDRKDATLKKLVKAFQHAVNTDKKFPGPALEIAGIKYPSIVIIKKPIVEDGLYGKTTSDALAVISFERIKP